MSFVWTIAEQHNGRLKGVSFELLSRGRKLADKLGTKLASVLIGEKVDEAGLEELIQQGADEVYSIQDPASRDTSSARVTRKFWASSSRSIDQASSWRRRPLRGGL